MGVLPLSLRHLKAVHHVVRLKSVTKAADYLKRSQSAITMAIDEIESQLEVTLFNRVGRGIEPTVYATVLDERIQLSMNEFLIVAKVYSRLLGKKLKAINNPVFNMDISYKRFAALLALDRHSSISLAARSVAVSETAIHKSINELESQLSMPLFERGAYATQATPFCLELVRYVKLAFSHLRHAIDELAAVDGVTQGQLAIGMLPYSRPILLPRAISRLTKEYPQLGITTREGTYANLELPLMSGELDLIVGATRPQELTPGLKSEALFRDELSLVVRAEHPLAGKKKIALGELEQFGWILPAKETPARQLFESFLGRNKVEAPTNYIETSSLTMLRGLLLESERLALISAHLVKFEVERGILTVLPVKLSETSRPIGVILRDVSCQAPGLKYLLAHLRTVADEMLAHP